MASVRFLSGPQTGEVIALDREKILFGRHGSCDFVMDHRAVSRRHFVIERNGGLYFLVDQDSGNGTFVNGNRVSWVELKDRDRIHVGPFTMQVELDPRAQPTDEADEALGSGIVRRPAFTEEHERLYPREYLEGIAQFNAGRYFEAHEIWEEIWLRATGDSKVFYQTLIQSAVALHHLENGNLRGAGGLQQRVLGKIASLPPVYMSLDLTDFERQFKARMIDAGQSADSSTQIRPLIRLGIVDAA